MSNTLLASYETAAVPVSWQLRFNPQLNTTHANTVGIPFLATCFTQGSEPMTVDWGDGAATIVDENSDFADFTHTYATSVDDIVVTMSSSTWDKYRIIVGLLASNLHESQTLREDYFQCTLIGVENRIPKLYGIQQRERYFDATYVGYNLFCDCNHLASIPSDLFDDNIQADDFDNCFYRTKLTTIPSALFANCIKAVSFSDCFAWCTSLTTIPPELFRNNIDVIYFISCFDRCTSLPSIPIGLFDSNTKVKSFNYCFQNCTALTSIPTNLFSNNTAVTSFNYCFRYVTLTGHTIKIGSAVVDSATSFCRTGGTVQVPANSTTFDTFTALADQLNITVQTA